MINTYALANRPYIPERDASMVSIVRILLLSVCAATLVRGQTSGKQKLVDIDSSDCALTNLVVSDDS